MKRRITRSPTTTTTATSHDFGPLQSSFYGVTWDRKKGRWRAAVRLAKRLGYEGQVYNIGMFDHAWVGDEASLVRSKTPLP